VCIAIRSAEELFLVFAPVGAALAREGYTEHDSFGVRLALEEALVNALKHGNQNDPAKEVRVRWEITAEEAVFEVEDEGPGFDPTEVPDPREPANREQEHGRGLLLMRHFMTEVEFSGCGNRVTLCKRRSPHVQATDRPHTATLA
jgi:serine/threonine-protein kinase RsbW